jgi:hypothetical protein
VPHSGELKPRVPAAVPTAQTLDLDKLYEALDNKSEFPENKKEK